MKKEEWNEGMNHLEPDLVEKYVEKKEWLRRKNKKRKGILLRFGAIAACFVLILSAVIAVPLLRRGNDPGIIPGSETASGTGNAGINDPPDHIPIIFDATVSPEKISGSSLEFIIGASTSDNDTSTSPPAFQFSVGITVKAKVVRNHPDSYYKLDVSSEYRPVAYRLIQMETVEVIIGKNVPQYFLYLIPEYVYVDMSVYDSLLISMSQVGAENYVLKNGTQNRMEAFELPVFGDGQNHPELGNIIAVSDGIFDEGLWQSNNWIYGYQFAKLYLDDPGAGNLVVYRGDSESTVISAIKEQIKEWYPVSFEEPSVITLDFKTQEAKAAIEYVKPFANGVFSQSYDGEKKLLFRRYINGCQTEETVQIDLLTEEVTYSEIRYTKEGMERIENIAAHLSEKANEYKKQLPTPPHIAPDGKTLLCLNLYAWYVKADDKLYGVIKTVWRYREKDDYFLQYYDDAYILYDISAGTAKDISRDDLVNTVGERNVYMGEYNESGTVIPIP